MARPLVVSQQKLAEKLSILQHRGVGMLTRIYNIKKACADQNSKPAFLSDKSLESSVKYVTRRFPNIDTKSLGNIQPLRNEILKSLSLYYYTFVDLLLEDPDPLVRRWAALALERVNDPSLAPAIRQALSGESDPTVRHVLERVLRFTDA